MQYVRRTKTIKFIVPKVGGRSMATYCKKYCQQDSNALFNSAINVITKQ